VVGPGWAELAAAVGSSSVVVGLVLGKDAAQVAFAEDEHPIGDLGPGGEHEPFRISVRARTPGRNFYSFDAGAGQDRVKGRGELPGTVADEELEVCSVVAEVRPQIADLLGGPRPVRVRGDSEDMDEAGADFDDEEAVQAPEVTQSTWKKSTASIVAACACRNWRQVVSVSRWGAGGIFRALRTRRMVDAPTR
jgi:hypothetical protein